MTVRYDVAIIGCGPTGAVAACLLGQAGLSVYVCDRSKEVYDKPRAMALDHEIMRIFQQLDLAAEIEPWVEPFTPSEYFGVDGQLIRRLTMAEPPYPLGYTPSMVFSQPPVERALRNRATSMANVSVELGVELVSLAQDGERVCLAMRDGSRGEQTVEASFVIGCDGATSTTRSLIGVSLDDLDFDEPWLVVDVLVNDRGMARLPTTSVQYCEPDRPCSYLIGTGNHRRWELSLGPDEDPVEAATSSATWRLLARWLSPDDGELWRQASYRFHALVARDWRLGRVFLAGDAAHQQPPFLGQGMCQGIRDVANLAWKLADVSGGIASGFMAEELLDSYGLERSTHVRALTARIKDIGATICERDPVAARQRDRRLLAECDGVVRDTPRQDLMPGLDAGWLSQHHTSGRGVMFPQPWLSHCERGKQRMDDVLSYGWRLIIADASLPMPVARHRLAVLRLGRGAYCECDGVVQTWMNNHRCSAAVVRPDHYVFGVASSEADLESLLDEWETLCGIVEMDVAR
ncbi:MAG: bifunctional 3-(3-hydroxy-phenyl)propionate/3-hydroxycinnamic acid hydroxylase [Ilumatobacteraceae bacterium]